MSLDTQIDTLRTELGAAIAAAGDEAALDAVRVAALGKKGSVSALLASLGAMAPDERKSAGPAINGLKTEIAGLIETRSAALGAAALDARLKAETLDITLPLQPAPTARGRKLHETDGFLDRSAAWAGYARDRHRKVGGAFRQCTLRHGDGGLATDGPMLRQRCGRHIEHRLLGVVRVGDEPAQHGS